MSLAALELNDQALLIQAQDGALHAEPGFARIAGDGIVTGEAARALAWREPQHGHHQYWVQLNQAPLVARQRWARHHGDLAFAQLRTLWDAAGKPRQLLLLVPPSLDDGQLSLLLGMCGALPCEVAGVLDSALAACLDARADTLYVDLHLHQAVVSLCRPGDGRISIAAQEVIPGAGLMQLHNAVAHHISHLLIDSARHDPLHDSAGEQDIHDRLPGWLAQLAWQDEVPDVLETARGPLPFILRRAAVRRLLTERLASLVTFTDRFPGSERVLAHGAGLLAGLSDAFAQADIAPQTAGVSLALAHLDALPDPAGGLYRVQELQRAEPAGVAHAPRNDRLATHLLHGDRAFPLASPLSIRLGGGALQLANALDDGAALTLVLRRDRLETLHREPGLELQLPAEPVPGAALEIAGHRLQLIEVAGG